MIFFTFGLTTTYSEQRRIYLDVVLIGNSSIPVMFPEVPLGAVGVAITLTVKDSVGNVVDISTASLKEILIKEPPLTKTVYTKEAYFVTDGTDGKLQFITSPNDLSVAGIWEVQANLNVHGYSGRTSITGFKVTRNIECN